MPRRNTAMADDIEVHFDAARCDLRLSCDEVAFARVRRVVCTEVGFEEIGGLPVKQVKHIEIESSPVLKKRYRLLGWVVGLGCIVACVALLFVFIVGATTVIRWLANHFAWPFQ